MKVYYSYLALVLSCAVFSSSSAEAADVSLVVCRNISECPYSDSSPTYELPLQGRIEFGDFEKFRQTLNGTVTLVLNSVGGNLNEAQRIMDLLVTPPSGIKIDGAYIPQNGICYSACAFIYMHAGYGKPAALKMHYSAKLGFHAPWLENLDNSRLYAAQDIVDTFALGQTTIKELTKHGRIPLELLLNFLDKGPHELFLIDTIYKALRLGILVGGFYDYKLYGPKVDWPENAWFGPVFPTRETAVWAMVSQYYTELGTPLDKGDAIILEEIARLQSIEDLYRLVDRLDPVWNLGDLRDEVQAIKVERFRELDYRGYEVIRFIPQDTAWLLSAVQFSREGLKLKEYEGWKQIASLSALPPGLPLEEIPTYLREVIRGTATEPIP
jgi:hypothetical protein